MHISIFLKNSSFMFVVGASSGSFLLIHCGMMNGQKNMMLRVGWSQPVGRVLNDGDVMAIFCLKKINNISGIIII